MSNSKTEALNNLYKCRDQIETALAEIENILKTIFPTQYDISYQHWIPQIRTALRDNTRWLPRGNYSMDYTLSYLTDQIVENSETKGVSKFIN